MPRQAVDFHYVEQKHWGIHERLEEWAAWVHPRQHSSVQPMFRQYRSSEAWVAPEARKTVDPIRASKTEAAVVALPDAYRHSLQWCYVFKSNPKQVCRALGVSMAGLALLIRDGRQMLVNRGLTQISKPVYSRPVAREYA